METHQVRAANDAAAAMLGIAAESLQGRSLVELLPGYVPGEDPSRAVDLAFAKPDGTPAMLELRRASVSYAGRACWLSTVRDVTLERAERAAQLVVAARANTLEEAPIGACLVDAAGDIQYANAAFHSLLGLDAGTAAGLSLRQFELGAGGEIHHSQRRDRQLRAADAGDALAQVGWLDDSTSKWRPRSSAVPAATAR